MASNTQSALRAARDAIAELHTTYPDFEIHIGDELNNKLKRAKRLCETALKQKD